MTAEPAPPAAIFPTMRVVARTILACLSAGASGCVSAYLPAGGPVQEGATGFYFCAPAGPAAGIRRLHISANAQNGGLILTFAQGDRERLDRVAGSGGRLYADEAYAWRIGSPASVLTDIRAIQTYQCLRPGRPG